MSCTLTVALSIVNCIKRETTEQLARKKAQSKSANTRIIIKYEYALIFKRLTGKYTLSEEKRQVLARGAVCNAKQAA